MVWRELVLVNVKKQPFVKHIPVARKVSNSIMVVMVLAISSMANAQGNTVVIPMFDDDVQAELLPTTPIASVDTDSNEYTINGFFTVTDLLTTLQWQRGDSPTTHNWNGARHYCSALELGGLHDWRLPSTKELHSIVDYGTSVAPLVNSVFITTNASSYWTITGRETSSGSAWYVDFETGTVFSGFKNANRYVRCVR